MDMHLKVVDGTAFPTVFVPSKDGAELENLLECIKTQKDVIEKYLEQNGAVLFRGWGLNDGLDFAKAVEAFEFKPQDYGVGVASRQHVAGSVYTANAYPLDLELGFHNEMAYQLKYPDVIMFFCEIPAPAGGETAIVQGKVVYDRMVKEWPKFMNELEQKGASYTFFKAEMTWQELYDTTDKSEAEQRAKEKGVKLKWLDNGEVHQVQGPRAAVLEPKNDGVKVWFNSIAVVKQQNQVTFGDGSPMADEAAEAAVNILHEEKTLLKWQKGDFALVDNRTVLHARMPSKPSKPPRKVLVSIGNKG